MTSNFRLGVVGRVHSRLLKFFMIISDIPLLVLYLDSMNIYRQFLRFRKSFLDSSPKYSVTPLIRNSFF